MLYSDLIPIAISKIGIVDNFLFNALTPLFPKAVFSKFGIICLSILDVNNCLY